MTQGAITAVNCPRVDGLAKLVLACREREVAAGLPGVLHVELIFFGAKPALQRLNEGNRHTVLAVSLTWPTSRAIDL